MSERGRPEWVKCIQEQPKHLNETKAMCGRGEVGFMFTGLDHAYLAVRKGNRLVPCPACVAEAVSCLANGSDFDPEEDEEV